MKKLLAVIFLSILSGCITSGSTDSKIGSSNSGSVSFQVSASTSGPFATLADSVVVIITASDMLTLTQNLSVTENAVSGLIGGIPAGSNRLFTIKVFDSTGTLQYQGSGSTNISAGATATLSITVVRIVGGANINGQIIESPKVGWTIFDDFEAVTLNSKWLPRSTTVGGLTKNQKKNGAQALQTTFQDYRYTFDKPLSNGQISWWYYDNGGTYFYVLTDTSKADLTVDNLHMTTVVPAGLASNRYSFYYKVGGYQQAISRTAGWHQMVLTVMNGQAAWSIDGVNGITIAQNLPVLGFQFGVATIDDFYVVSNTN